MSGNGPYNPSAGYTPTTAGDYWWYASYSGDCLNNTATSTCGVSMSETVVAMVTPTLSVAAPPSGYVGTAISATTINATLSGGSAPTGPITFTVFGPQSTAPSTCTRRDKCWHGHSGR